MFTNVQCPSNSCTVTVLAPGTNTVVALTTVTLGNDPSTTTLDLKTGATQDQLFLSGKVLAPLTPPTQAPTVTIRVSFTNGTRALIFDSATLGGSGGFGTYRLAIGRVYLPKTGPSGAIHAGDVLNVALFENGTEVGHVSVIAAQPTGSAVVANVADIQGVAPPSPHRVLQGTITKLLAFAPGGSSGTNSVPLAGATVRINDNTNKQTRSAPR